MAKTPQQQHAAPANGAAPDQAQLAKPARPAGPVATLRSLLDQSKAQIAMALPKHMTPDRMIRVALTAFQRSPALLECDPISVVGCVVQASELGLELTGPLGQAYMVPYWNKQTGRKEAQFQIGYRGLVRLAYNSGLVSTFTAHEVYANDEFRFQYGTRPSIHHAPAMQNRGPVVAVYAVLALKDGTTDFEVMSAEAVEEHRKKYSKQSSGQSPWATAWEEMAKKTVIRRLAKRAPLSADLHTAAALDEYGEAGVDAQPALPGGATAEATRFRMAALSERLAVQEALPPPDAADPAGATEPFADAPEPASDPLGNTAE